MGTAKIQRRRSKGVKRKGLPESLPTSVQKSYFLLGAKERDVLNQALSKYRPGQTEPILVGGEKLLKPALQLMNAYRLRIDEIKARRNRYDVLPVRWVMSARSLPGCPVLLMDVKTRHWIG
jgi:hypothetical protein